MSKHKFIEERLDDCEENVANVAQYSFEEFQKQAEENRNMALMLDNVEGRLANMEEQFGILMGIINDISWVDKIFWSSRRFS